jgi:menaquinol-cytochrome c reductase iron-sulfur subunit
MNQNFDTERRRLLKTAALAGTACLITGCPLISYAIAPALRKAAATWVDVGQAAALAQSGVKMLPYKYLAKDGWMVLPREGLICAKTASDGRLTTFSSICPHLGCSVRWAEATATFECPCHSGRFDADGRPIAGPPTKPLVRLEHKVESGKLLVLVSV